MSTKSCTSNPASARPPDVEFEEFTKLGIRAPNASVKLTSYEQLISEHLKEGQAKIFTDDRVQLELSEHQRRAGAALCHVVRERLGTIHPSGLFIGLLRDAMVASMKSLLESGILSW